KTVSVVANVNGVLGAYCFKAEVAAASANFRDVIFDCEEWVFFNGLAVLHSPGAVKTSVSERFLLCFRGVETDVIELS
ncbi:unnamed protein product, partial [Rotaria magnacalcarata]